MPALNISLYLDEPQDKGPGYQAPGTIVPPDPPIPRQPKFKKFGPKPKEKDAYPFPNHQKRREEKFVPEKAKKVEGERNTYRRDGKERKGNSDDNWRNKKPKASEAEETSKSSDKDIGETSIDDSPHSLDMSENNCDISSSS